MIVCRRRINFKVARGQLIVRVSAFKAMLFRDTSFTLSTLQCKLKSWREILGTNGVREWGNGIVLVDARGAEKKATRVILIWREELKIGTISDINTFY